MSYGKENMGGSNVRRNWKATQPQPLGQRFGVESMLRSNGVDQVLRPSGVDNVLRSSNAVNISVAKPTECPASHANPVFIAHKKSKKVRAAATTTDSTPISPTVAAPTPSYSSLSLTLPSALPAPPMTPAYTNNPYSLEFFTPPPPCESEEDSAAREAIELDEHKIQQRLKQIGFGKSTKGYENYLTLVSKHLREPENEDHPATPRANQKCSKRSWDGQLKKWRRLLHRWDNVLQQFSDTDSVVGSEKENGATDEDSTPTRRASVCPSDSWSCGSGSGSNTGVMPLLDLYSDEPRKRSWGSECSETPDMNDLSGVTLECDHSNYRNLYY